MKIEELIKRYDGDSVLMGVFQELDYLRRSQMQPAVKYMVNSTQKQFIHMRSELAEIKENLYCFQNSNPGPGVTFIKDDLIAEIIDLQFSCQTMLEGPLKQTKEQIANAIQKVVVKNKARDYDK